MPTRRDSSLMKVTILADRYLTIIKVGRALVKAGRTLVKKLRSD